MEDRRQISQSGGRFPRWNKNGEIFFLTNDGFLITTETIVHGHELRTGELHTLFRVPLNGPDMLDFSPDGRRIIAGSSTLEISQPWTIVQNWAAALRK